LHLGLGFYVEQTQLGQVAQAKRKEGVSKRGSEGEGEEVKVRLYKETALKHQGS
jgi:hypothetical protein